MAIDQFDVADLILMNFADPVNDSSEVVRSLANNLRLPVAVSFMGGGEEEKNGRVTMQRAGIPVFSSPVRAMKGIEAVAWVMDYRVQIRLD